MLKWKNNSAVKREKTFIALDIGTEYVKAIVGHVKDNQLEILGSAKRKQTWGEMESGAITDIAGLIEKCSSAMKEAEAQAGITTNKLILGVAGELVKGATSTVHYKRRDIGSKIHQEELKNIIHKVQWKAFEKVRADIAYETGHNEIDVKLVYAAIVDTRIDGYKVANPIGFQGKEISMSLFNAFSPLIHFGALQTICAELDKELLSIMAEPYALGMVLGGTELQGYSGIFIDVGGATTDVSVVVDGAVIGTKMFHFGGKAFTKRLANALNVSHDEAEEVKIAYSEQRLEQQSNNIVLKALTPDVDLWLAGVFYSLQEMQIENLPVSVYLCGGASLLPLLKDGLEKPDWHKKLNFPRKPQIKWLAPKHITHIKDLSGKLDSPADTPVIALANTAIDILSEEKILTKMLQKVVRLMQV